MPAAATAGREGRRLAARPGRIASSSPNWKRKNLSPAPPADKRTLLRRVTFDLIGLPPTPEEIDAFLKRRRRRTPTRRWWIGCWRRRSSASAGPATGSTWCATRETPRPRVRLRPSPTPTSTATTSSAPSTPTCPTTSSSRSTSPATCCRSRGCNPAEGFNESILGTGFWFLGEEVHSPVDVRQDQADRFDNRIDVFGKTFLGLTVACARCHDHKFDAISTKDYYSLFGFLESSNYRLVRFDSLEHNRGVAAGTGRSARARAADRRAGAGRRRPAGGRAHGRLSAGGAGSRSRPDRKRSESRSDRRGPQARRRPACAAGPAAPAGRGEGRRRPAARLGQGLRRPRRGRPEAAGGTAAAAGRCADEGDGRRRRLQGRARSWSITPAAGRTTGCRTTRPSAPARRGRATCASTAIRPIRRAARRTRRRRVRPDLGRSETGARRRRTIPAPSAAWCEPAGRSARRPSRVDAGKVFYLVKGAGMVYAAVGFARDDRRAAARPARRRHSGGRRLPLGRPST